MKQLSIKRMSLLAVALLALGCAAPATDASDAPGEEGRAATEAPTEGLARATFAGGCFWCMEPPYDKLEGVVSTTSGYTGGPEVRPTYQQVAYGRTGHTEAVEVVYDPQKVGYERLLHVFWRNIDPTVRDRQFCDVGTQYRTAIFVHDEEQRRLAEESLAQLRQDPPFEGEIVTPILDAQPFYPAEEYHQNFYEKNPLRYKTYRRGCGRDARLEELWGDEAGG